MSDASDSDDESVEFALSPAAAINGILNYKKTAAWKVFERGTTKLQEDLFDCNPGKLYQFLDAEL